MPILQEALKWNILTRGTSENGIFTVKFELDKSLFTAVSKAVPQGKRRLESNVR